MSTRLNVACMLAWAASCRRKASTSARRASSAIRDSRRRASSMKKPSTTGAITESASRNAVGPMPAGCQARGTSSSRPLKSKPGRRGVTVTPSVQLEVVPDIRSLFRCSPSLTALRDGQRQIGPSGVGVSQPIPSPPAMMPQTTVINSSTYCPTISASLASSAQNTHCVRGPLQQTAFTPQRDLPQRRVRSATLGRSAIQHARLLSPIPADKAG